MLKFYRKNIPTDISECHQSLQENRLDTTKEVVAITTNVIVIGVIAMIKKLIQVVVINSEAIGLCNTRLLQ